MIFSKRAVQVRTSTDRTGCTNFFREKMHFLRAGVDKRFDAYKTPHSAATGRSDIMYCTRDPKVGTLVFFASCLNIRKILLERRKSGRTATEKEKCPYWLQGCNSKGREKNVY